MLYSCVPSHFACTCTGPRAPASARGSLCRSGRGATPPRGGSATQGLVDERAGAWACLSIHGFRNFSRRAYRTGFSGSGGLELGAGGPPGCQGPGERVPAAPDPGEPPRAQEMGPGRPTYPAPGGPRHGRPPCPRGDHLQRVRGGPPRRPAGAASPTLPRLPAEAGPPGAGRREDPLPGLRASSPGTWPPGPPARPVRRLRPGPIALAARPGHRHPGESGPGGLGGAGPRGGVEARRVPVSPARQAGPGGRDPPGTPPATGRPRAPGDN